MRHSQEACSICQKMPLSHLSAIISLTPYLSLSLQSTIDARRVGSFETENDVGYGAQRGKEATSTGEMEERERVTLSFRSMSRKQRRKVHLQPLD